MDMLNPEILSPGGQGLLFQNLETFDSPFNLCPLWESRPHPKIRIKPALTLFTVRPAARCLPLRKCSGELTCVATDITCRLASVGASFECTGLMSPWACFSHGVWVTTTVLSSCVWKFLWRGVFLCKSSPLRASLPVRKRGPIFHRGCWDSPCWWGSRG